MRPVVDAWVRMITTARPAGVPVIYATPISRGDGADFVTLPTDLSAETGVPPLTNAVEGTAQAGFPGEIARRSKITFSSSAGRAPSTGWVSPNCCMPPRQARRYPRLADRGRSVRITTAQASTTSDTNCFPRVSGLKSSATMKLAQPAIVPINIGMANPSCMLTAKKVRIGAVSPPKIAPW